MLKAYFRDLMGLYQSIFAILFLGRNQIKESKKMRIFVLEDDFSQQTRIETTIEKLLKEHHITPSSFEVFGKADQLLGQRCMRRGRISYSFWILRFEMRR